MSENKNIGNFEISKFPKTHIPTLDFLTFGDKAHYVKGLIEVDVTKGREYIRRYEKQTGFKFFL